MNPCLVQGRHTYSQGCVINKRYASDQPWVLVQVAATATSCRAASAAPYTATHNTKHLTAAVCLNFMLVKAMQDFMTHIGPFA